MDDPYSNLNPMEPASQYPHMTEEEQSNQELQREIQFVHLEIRQQPKCARVAIGKDKDRKPIDPPPMVQLQLAKEHDPTERYIHSPYYFATCTLLPPKESAADKLSASLGGTLVSSLHRLKDINNKEGAFFIFPDLSVKVEGQYRLQFSLFQMRESKGLGAYFHTCNFIKAIESDVFTVYSTKNWPGMEASTFLTRSFSDQGVRLRIRKEPRTLLRKRGPASNDYQPRHYNTQTRRETAAEAEGSQERRSGPEASVSPPLSRRVEQYSSTPRRPEPSQIITPPESRQADQYYTSTGPYDPRPSSDGDGDEQPSKRPRTGSDQYSNQVQQPAPAFGQQQTSANSQYAGTYMLQQQYPPVSAMPYQQPGYSYAQPQLPSSSPLYYSQQYGRAPENPASFQQNARLPSPSQPMLPQLQMRPFQPQAGFTSMNSMVSPTQQRIGSDDFGASYSPQHTNPYGSAAMGPPLASHSGAGGVSGVYSISPATSIAHRYALPHRTSVDEYQAGGLPAQHIQRSSSMSSNWDEGYRSGTMAPATLPSNTENQYPN